MNSKKLYVWGLPSSVSDRKLEELFWAYGTVKSAQIIKNRMTRQSQGFGFVEMSSQAEAQASVEHLNGKEIENRTITVDKVKERVLRGSRRRDFGRSRW